MAASSAKKMPTVEAFCSAQDSLEEGVWLERAKKLVAEVPGEEIDTRSGLSHVLPQRSAPQSWPSSGRGSTCSARSSRVSPTATCSKRNLFLSGFFFFPSSIIP